MADNGRKFNNSDEMREKAVEYFKGHTHPDDFQNVDEKQEAVKAIRDGLIPTKNGLALFMGFTNPKSLDNYKGKSGFAGVMEWIRTKLASYWELNLNSKFANGAEKWLESVQPSEWKQERIREQRPPVAAIYFIGETKSEHLSGKALKTIEAEIIPPKVEEVKALPLAEKKEVIKARVKGTASRKKTEKKKAHK